MKTLQTRKSSEFGATLIEAGVVVALVAIVCLAGVYSFQEKLVEKYCGLNERVINAGTEAADPAYFSVNTDVATGERWAVCYFNIYSSPSGGDVGVSYNEWHL